MREVIYLNSPSLIDAKKRIKKSLTLFFNDKNIEIDENVLLFLENKKYFIKTHGCQANYRDEENYSGLLELINMKRTFDINEASLILINTCSVRENANNKVYAEIGNLKKLKEIKGNKDLILVITGCMAETKDTLDKLINTYSQIDLILGTHNIINLLTLLNLYLKNNGKNRYVDSESKEGDIIENLPSSRRNKFSAFVNISFGCDKFCTYCIVPFTRGKERSRSVEAILKECKLLKEEGYKEITLLGQNVDSYAKDFKIGDSSYLYNGNKVTFALLLDEVAKLNIPRVRFLTSYPSDFKDDVIEVIAKHSNIMKYIHLPVQSGSNNVLKRMNRRYTVEEYLDLISRIRNKIKDISISTDLIVGFPNETIEEFNETLEFIKKVNYSSAFTFIYSKRKGTIAEKIIDKINYKEKVERFKLLTKELEGSISNDNKKYIDKIVPVLVNSVSKTNKDFLSGTMENNKTVNFKGNKSLIGNIVNVKITEDKLYSFIGELINE